MNDLSVVDVPGEIGRGFAAVGGAIQSEHVVDAVLSSQSVYTRPLDRQLCGNRSTYVKYRSANYSPSESRDNRTLPIKHSPLL